MLHKVLIIDDEKVFLELVVAIVDFKEYELQVCSDPIEALSLISKTDFSVIITDIQMPGLNGMQLLEHPTVRSTSAIKMIISGYSSLEIAIKAINSGFVWRYIQKPCTIDYLKISISNAIAFFEEKRDKENFIKQLIIKDKALEELNQKLSNLLEERNKTIVEMSRLIKLLATSDDREFVMQETIKTLKSTCGDQNFKVSKEKPLDSMSFPIMNEKECLGFITYDKVESLQNELILHNLRVYAPIIEFCLSLMNAEINTKKILLDMNYLTKKEKNE